MAVQIEFDKPRELKFNIAAVRDLETVLDGKPLAGIINDIGQIGVTAIVASLWAGLKHQDKALNLNLVAKMLDTYLENGGDVRVLTRAVSQAIEDTGLFRNALDDDGPEGNAPTEQAKT